MTNILDAYIVKCPSAQNMLDIFKGEWSSKMPIGIELETVPGAAALFEDQRIVWADQMIGGFRGKNILELGPLEGGHTYMLSNFGASEITSIEANSRSFLKCLITKEIFCLTNVRYLCGDFIQFLETSTEHYDAIIASGVLYHMKDPLYLLEKIAAHTNNLFLWTHYYDVDVITSNTTLAKKFNPTIVSNRNGIRTESVIQSYLEALNWNGFCGGSADTSIWLTRSTILDYLNCLGFTMIEINHEHLNHPNGPAFSLFARKV